MLRGVHYAHATHIQIMWYWFILLFSRQ